MGPSPSDCTCLVRVKVSRLCEISRTAKWRKGMWLRQAEMPSPFYALGSTFTHHWTDAVDEAKMALAFFKWPQTAFSILVLHVKTADTVLQVKERTIIQRPAFFSPLISSSMQHELCWGGISLFPVRLSSASLAGRFLKVVCWRKEKKSECDCWHIPGICFQGYRSWHSLTT